jgi:hypothetical protein
MKPEEKQILRERLALSVYKAHEALQSASTACNAMGVDCRNIQNIGWVDGRDRYHPILVNGKLVNNR